MHCKNTAYRIRTECVRLKNFVVDADIRDNNIRHCGVYDFALNEGGKNGEGIYIGTSNSQVRDADVHLLGCGRCNRNPCCDRGFSVRANNPDGRGS